MSHGKSAFAVLHINLNSILRARFQIHYKKSAHIVYFGIAKRVELANLVDNRL